MAHTQVPGTLLHDVKLTFSNAMKHNPLTNWVHELAGEFSRMFTLEWKSLEAKWSEEEKSDLVYKDQGLMEISKRKLPPKLHGHLRRLGLLCENKDDGETASEIQILTSSCFKSNVIGKFANTTGGTCGQDSSLKDLKNNNTNPKCESATSKRLGNPASAYPKGSFGDMKSHCGHDNAFSEASSGVECLKTCEGQLSPKQVTARLCNVKESLCGDMILKAQRENSKHYLKAALKLLRQRQSLPRLALEEMEKSVDVYDSFAIMKDLEMMGVAKCIGHDRVLEGLGLYLKNEFPEDDGDDVEEGEIICKDGEYIEIDRRFRAFALFLIHSHVNIKSSSTFHVVQRITNKCLPSIFQLKYLEDLTFEGCLSIDDDDGLETLERGRKSIKNDLDPWSWRETVRKNADLMYSLDEGLTGDSAEFGVLAPVSLPVTVIEEAMGIKDLNIAKQLHPVVPVEMINLGYYKKITDMSLVSLSKCSRLRVVEIQGCPSISSTGIVSISIGCKLLTELDVKKCQMFNDVGLLSLTDFSHNLKQVVVALAFLLCSTTLIREVGGNKVRKNADLMYSLDEV
ncbi:hypothetical protein Scep_027301 [Stephania cephalantha]|uniref:Uncharacterized protein n=1 Tax=Stephania cephalantha TaxID=152367 RepID=A0AAP0E7V8_9MAGN